MEGTNSSKSYIEDDTLMCNDPAEMDSPDHEMMPNDF
jgi:hypothetical protein